MVAARSRTGFPVRQNGGLIESNNFGTHYMCAKFYRSRLSPCDLLLFVVPVPKLLTGIILNLFSNVVDKNSLFQVFQSRWSQAISTLAATRWFVERARYSSESTSVSEFEVKQIFFGQGIHFSQLHAQSAVGSYCGTVAHKQQGHQG